MDYWFLLKIMACHTMNHYKSTYNIQQKFWQNSEVFIKEKVFEFIVCGWNIILSQGEMNQCVYRFHGFFNIKSYWMYFTWPSWYFKPLATHQFVEKLVQINNKKYQSSASLALFEENPYVTCGFPSQKDSNAKGASIQWYHHHSQPCPHFAFSCWMMLV